MFSGGAPVSIKNFFERKNSTMKKLNKKGFTVVELVIVIAVIAILAGVLIPTFANVVAKANESAAMQQAKNAYENYLADYADKTTLMKDFYIKAGDYYFHVDANGQFNAKSTAPTAGKDLVVLGEKATAFSTTDSGVVVTEKVTTTSGS